MARYGQAFETRAWAGQFVHCYNVEQRHDDDILAARHTLYTQARAANPRRWSGATRDWTPRGAVTLNPERDAVIDAAVLGQDKRTGTT